MKKQISLALVISLLATVFTVIIPKHTKAAIPEIIINQFYGGAGSSTDGPISHGFVELYNLSNNPINLDTYSLQYSSEGKAWNILPLTGKTINARSSFLIRCIGKADSPRYSIDNYDMHWKEVEFSNRSVSFAIVANQTLLSPVITEEERGFLIDLVGSVNNPEEGDGTANYDGEFIIGTTRQVAARRIDFVDTNDNRADFETLDYRNSGIDDEKLAEVRPRCSGDGKWGEDIIPVPIGKRLVFSKESGAYTTPFNLTMTTGYPAGVIRYTTDGSDPKPNSKKYTNAVYVNDRTNENNILANVANIIPLDNKNLKYTLPSTKIYKGNVIKAQVFSEAGTPLTDVYTKSYFINPSYDNLPILSIVTDQNNLFDSNTGIYVHPNYTENGEEWERPVHVSLIEPNGELGFSQNLGMRMHGGASKNVPQKSLRFYAKSNYEPGKSYINYDIFNGNAKAMDGSDITSFKRFIIRNSGNDNSNGYSFTMIRDAMIHSLMEGTNVTGQAYRQAVAFINGEFWGIYNIRERIDEYMIDSNYKIGDKDMIEVYEVYGKIGWHDLYKEMYDWFEKHENLNTPELYAKAQTFLDIDNFIDYYIIETFVYNTDWPQNNIEIWRYKTEKYPEIGSESSPDDGRWRYLLKDLDFGFGIWVGLSDNEENPFKRLFINDMGIIKPTSESTLLFRRLCTNTEFVDKFTSRYCDLMNTNLKPDVVKAKIDEMAGLIENTMPKHLERWVDMGGGGWKVGMKFLREYADARPEAITRHLKESFSLSSTLTLTLKTNQTQGYMKINDTDILDSTPGVNDPNSWNGTYFANKEQKIIAVPYSGYKFEKFVVGSRTYTENPINIKLTQNTTVQAVFTKLSNK